MAPQEPPLDPPLQSYKRSMSKYDIANARVATPLRRTKEARGVHVQPVNHGRYAPALLKCIWSLY